MSNFPILDSPQALPGKCGVCGYSGNERKYLSTNLDFEDYGILIICEPCVGAMANDFNFLQPAQALSLENRVEEAERELVTLRAAIIQLESLGDIVAGLVGRQSSILSNNDGVAVRSNDDEPPISPEPDGETGADDSVQRLLDFDPDEQTDESGPNDLSDFASLGSTDFNL